MVPLRTVVYVSTATTAMSEAQLSALLVEARDLNAKSHVSGVLLYGGGTFMQCFEGSEESVALTYERIRASRKHTGIIELLDETVPMRSFASREMGFKWANESELLALSTAQWQRQAASPDPALQGSAGLALLRQFWDQDQR